MYKKVTSVLLTAAVLGMTPGVLADDHNSGGEQPPSNQMGIEAYSVSTLVYKDALTGDTETQTYAGMTLRLTDQFKANFTASIENGVDMVEDGVDMDAVGAFIAQAEGVLTVNKDGNPILFVFGKLLDHDMKAQLSAVARSDKFELASTEVEEVIGFYVDLTPPVLDSLQVAVTETEGGDMDLGKEIRVTAQGHKALSDMVTAYGSLAYEFADGGDDDDQDAGAISFGLAVDTSGIIEGTSWYGQATLSQDGFNGARGDRITIDTGINWQATDSLVISKGIEYNEDDFVEELMPYIGAEYEFKDGVSLYGNIGHEIESDDTRFEFGGSYKW